MVVGIRREVQLARDDGHNGHADQQHGKNLAGAPWADGLHNTPTEGSSQDPVPSEDCSGGTTGKVSVEVYCRHCHHVKPCDNRRCKKHHFALPVSVACANVQA